MEFSASNGLEVLGVLAAQTASPANTEEICVRALKVVAETLRARAALILQTDDAGSRVLSASWGEPAGQDLLRVAEAAFQNHGPIEEPPAEETSPFRIAWPLVMHHATRGVIALEYPSLWNAMARSFLASAVQILAGALEKTRAIESSRMQGELSARRNIELEALRELAGRLQDLDSEDAMLQAALELVLEKLELQAGWIFWGESSKGRLELAANLGIAEEFVTEARKNGVGTCLCVDVFATGRLQVARNTMDCPRLPGLLGSAEPMTHACVPLKFERGVLGVLNIANRPGHLFTPQDLGFLETVGNHLCMAVDKARTARAQAQLYREAQENLRELQEAQYGMMRAERLATLGTLASSLAHEVRNPLNSIGLQLVLLSRRFARLAPESQDELMPIVETARNEIARLNGLVEEFLSLSSIERLSLRDADPEETAREALALMAPMALERRVQISEEFCGPLPSVPLDREKLKQVLINLIRNAIEAMPEGGSLAVSTGVVDGATVIRIADSGKGIDPDLDVFDFFMTTKAGGTGLGLPIAKRIVEAHGGTLTYESSPAQGTVFSVTLPVT